MATLALLGSSTLVMAADTKVGVLMDITGPIASFIPPIQNSANLAFKHVNEQGGLLDGKAVAVYGDTTGSAQGSVDAAGKLVNIENVPVIMGALMSGTTIAAAEAAAIPAGVVMVSPTATSPAMTGIKDNDLLYRLVPSDNYQGDVLAKMVLAEGIKKVAVAYVTMTTASVSAKPLSRPTKKPVVKWWRKPNMKRRKIPIVRNWQLCRRAVLRLLWLWPMRVTPVAPSSSNQLKVACSRASSAPMVCAMKL